MINYKINANPMLMKLCYTNNNQYTSIISPIQAAFINSHIILFFIPVQRVSISK